MYPNRSVNRPGPAIGFGEDSLQVGKLAALVLFGLLSLTDNSRAAALTFNANTGNSTATISFEMIGNNLSVTVDSAQTPTGLFFTIAGVNSLNLVSATGGAGAWDKVNGGIALALGTPSTTVNATPATINLGSNNLNLVHNSVVFTFSGLNSGTPLNYGNVGGVYLQFGAGVPPNRLIAESPEPGSLILMGAGLIVLASIGRRRYSRTAANQ
jgi:hypothetical protein